MFLDICVKSFQHGHMAGKTKKHGSNTRKLWLDAAYEMLVEGGVDAVKIMPLARRVRQTRTSFYWYFRDREALLDALIVRWEEKNTGNLVSCSRMKAATITEAVFNLFDCWLNNDLFDAQLDLAIRNWARTEPGLQARLARADERRTDAIAHMFRKFGCLEKEAVARANTVLYTQIGYISMQVKEPLNVRVARMPDYVAVFTGQRPSQREVETFFARHLPGANPE